MNRLAACIIVSVLFAVVVYVWIQDTSTSSSSANDKSDAKTTCKLPTKSVSHQNDTEEKEEEMDDTKEVVMDEGVIKYECEWIKGEIELNAIKSLLSARNKLHDLGLIGAYTHNSIGFGNISQRIQSKTYVTDTKEDKVSFYITGTQTSSINNKDMNESHFCVVNNYDIPQNKLFCVGPIRASSESMTHATVYELDENINCVVHIHNNILWNNCVDTLPTTDKNVKYGTPEMAKEVERLYTQNVSEFRNMKVFVMGGHEDGLIAFGESVEDATNLMIKVYREYGNVRSDEIESGEEESTITNKEMNVDIIDDYATPVMTCQQDNNDNNDAKNGGFVRVESDQLTL